MKINNEHQRGKTDQFEQQLGQFAAQIRHVETDELLKTLDRILAEINQWAGGPVSVIFKNRNQSKGKVLSLINEHSLEDQVGMATSGHKNLKNIKFARKIFDVLYERLKTEQIRFIKIMDGFQENSDKKKSIGSFFTEKEEIIIKAFCNTSDQEEFKENAIRFCAGNVVASKKLQEKLKERSDFLSSLFEEYM